MKKINKTFMFTILLTINTDGKVVQNIVTSGLLNTNFIMPKYATSIYIKNFYTRNALLYELSD